MIHLPGDTALTAFSVSSSPLPIINLLLRVSHGCSSSRTLRPILELWLSLCNILRPLTPNSVNATRLLMLDLVERQIERFAARLALVLLHLSVLLRCHMLLIYV